MTSAAEQNPDTRNLHWRQNNVGSTLLQKLGWKEGQALGSKQRRAQQKLATSQDGGSVEDVMVSSEGLKVVKRKEGLGIGATTVLPGVDPASHHESFTALLETLKQEHSVADESSSKKRKSIETIDDVGAAADADNNNDNKKSKKSSSSSKKKKKKTKKSSGDKKETIFASNRITNSRVRQSKFAAKSATDMACIFGKDFSSAEIADQTRKSMETERKLRKERKQEKKKAQEDQAAETKRSDAAIVEKEERKKRREEKQKKRKRDEKS